jgi:alpha-glucosidase
VQRVLRALVFACCWLVLAPAARAGWRSVDGMGAPARQPAGLVFRGPQGTASVSVVDRDGAVVRVRFSPARDFGRDHSYARAGDAGAAAAGAPAPRVTVDVRADRSTLATAALRVQIQHAPFRVAFFTAAGEPLDEDDPEQGTAVAGSTVRVWKRLRPDEHVFGLGEKNGRLDKRGWKLGGYSYTMWNSDTYGYDADTDPIYVSVPFLIVMRAGRAHGIFLDNTFRSNFDIGHQSDGLLSFGADGGELDYYFIDGPSPKQVIERYTALTGHAPLPPLWALGYHQCRYSYYPEAKLRSLATEFRERRIPADVLWLDIHYLDAFKPFTWDRQRFPALDRLIADLRRQGLRTVTIIDPHPKKEKGYPPFDSGLAGDHFVKNPDGSLYTAPVWPSKAEKDPGPSVFPDFSRPATRLWWGGLYEGLLAAGVAGIWNDMNEPAAFGTPTGTMPLDVRHDNEGQPTDHREIHNVYGMLMSRSTFEGLARLRPNERPFVLTRASFAGGQRYAAVWTGDNQTDWAHLRHSIPTLLGLGLSGFPFVGGDVGGYAGNPSAELFTRWLQMAVFSPFMRTHAKFGTADREPWSFGPAHEQLNRRAIELRYELLPYIYNVMHEASVTGLPAMRPLFLEFPDDPLTYDRDDEFLFGHDLLVAPVLHEGEKEREVLLPAGDWYDFWTGLRHAGGASVKVPVTLASLPIFVRAGAFLFRQPVVQHTGQMPGQPLEVTVFPADRSEARLYEDDGATLDYTRGRSVSRRFTQRRSGGRTVIEVSAPETSDGSGGYRPPARKLVLIVRGEGQPRRTLVGGKPVAPRIEGGSVIVELPDRFEPVQVSIEGLR